MMLCHQSIDRCIKAGVLQITPYDPKNLGPASYDLRLGRSFVELQPHVMGVEMPVPREMLPPEFRNLPNNVVPTQKQVKVRTMDEDYPTKKIEVPENQGIILPPKGFILATTEEYIKASSKYAIYVEGRSSIGRMGLQVQNAGFVDPGFEGQITLELFNASDVPIALMPGRRICQIVVIELDYETITPYCGKYVGQTDATASRIQQDYEVPVKTEEDKRTSSGIHLL